MRVGSWSLAPGIRAIPLTNFSKTVATSREGRSHLPQSLRVCTLWHKQRQTCWQARRFKTTLVVRATQEPARHAQAARRARGAMPMTRRAMDRRLYQRMQFAEVRRCSSR